ncbi:hypothetical protein HYV87_01615 [Candidatus Woesearchaeota archaeon]|nr:hypothetical protein [Candidatus Woesearchaeota archaeon]MBI2581810.1 hypothetical protein [Candidatus Woesearchaeota archaeon]
MLKLGRWGVTFCSTYGAIPEEVQYELLREATKMYLRDEQQKDIKTDSVEGRISTEGKYQTIGAYGGQRFDAEVDVDDITAKLSFLVCELSGKRISKSSRSLN